MQDPGGVGKNWIRFRELIRPSRTQKNRGIQIQPHNVRRYLFSLILKVNITESLLLYFDLGMERNVQSELDSRGILKMNIQTGSRSELFQIRIHNPVPMHMYSFTVQLN